MSAGRLVGQSVLRVEDPKILTGAGRYLGDLVLPGMLHAAFVRSPLAHARIAAIDVAAALEVPGVHAVLTAADLGVERHPMTVAGPPVFHALATDTVRHVGDPVAIVLADGRYAAEDARDLVELDLDPLPAVTTMEQALDPSLPPLFPDCESNVRSVEAKDYGDPDAAFAAAAVVVRETFTQQRQAMVPMEGRAIAASYEPATGDLTVWASNQRAHGLRVDLADVLGHPAHRLRVVSPDIGGGFGQKIATYREDVAVCLASMLLHRPVRWVEDRGENLTAAGQARDERIEIEAAADADGRLLGLKARYVLDAGAYPAVPIPAHIYGWVVRALLPGASHATALRWEQTVVQTNKASFVPFRGPWAIESWAREALLDRIAAEVGIDVFEVRRRNLIRPGEQPRRMATGPTLVGVTVLETLERAAELVDLEAFRAEQAAARAEGRLLGIGVSSVVEAAPGPPDWGEASGLGNFPEPGRVRLEADGRVTVFTAESPHGQGHQTTMAQVVADRLGVRFEDVSVVWGDTQTAPFFPPGTGGSRAAMQGNGSVLLAAGKVREKVLRLAGHLLEIAPEDLELADGRVSAVGAPDRSIALKEVARRAAYGQGVAGLEPGPIDEIAHFRSPRGGWACSTHVCIVEVDAETGLVRIPRYLVVEDCGQLINPAIVDGQIRGGVVQGIGSVLLEECVYDEDGQILTGSFVDYLLPSAPDMPAIEIVHLESPPFEEIDFRGVGEGGAVSAPPTLANALADAIGTVPTIRPVTPTRVLEWLGTIERE